MTMFDLGLPCGLRSRDAPFSTIYFQIGGGAVFVGGSFCTIMQFLFYFIAFRFDFSGLLVYCNMGLYWF